MKGLPRNLSQRRGFYRPPDGVRADDKASEAAMEDRKKVAYF